MTRFLVILPFVVVALDVFGIVDVILADERRVRALNKPVWVIIILLLPLIGAILWFVLGKERRQRSDPQRTTAPDDDPTFLRNLGRTEQDERIRRLEQELSELDDDPPKE